MKDFILFKRTYPISTIERNCDGYNYLIDNTIEDQRREWGIDIESIKKNIKEGEKYIYQVGKENGEFKIFTCSFENYAIIRKYIYGVVDEI